MRQLSPLLQDRKKGQATTELAVMGTIVIMLLGYLVQQGYLYNSRQALEMYAFRQALSLSQRYEKGISLTVIREVIAPSFFTGLSRQRLMATASVDYNPYKLYIPHEEDPEDVPVRQLVQDGEAMIRSGLFLEVPPTLVKVHRKNANPDEIEWMWTSSAISEIDPQTRPVRVTNRSSNYTNRTFISENRQAKTVNKQLGSQDEINIGLNFEEPARIQDSYRQEDWEQDIDWTKGGIEVRLNTIPRDVALILNERVEKVRNVRTSW